MALQHLASQRLSNGLQDADPTPTPSPATPSRPTHDQLIAQLAADIKVVRKANGLGSENLKLHELSESISSVIVHRYLPDADLPGAENGQRLLPFSPKSMAWIREIHDDLGVDFFAALSDALNREG